MKLHYAADAVWAAKIICQGTRFARTLTHTMMRISDTIGDPDSVLWNHRAAAVHHRRASSSDTISQKPRRSGCAPGVTWRLWNCARIKNSEPQNIEVWFRSPRCRRYNPYEPASSPWAS